jgi:pre-mRNA-processing factor 19
LIETPVISKVSGHIFEKRLIEKHIESTGTCPITGRPLNFDDLIEVKVSRVQKPRPVTATSIPSLLSLLQNEWDALLLE